MMKNERKIDAAKNNIETELVGAKSIFEVVEGKDHYVNYNQALS